MPFLAGTITSSERLAATIEEISVVQAVVSPSTSLRIDYKRAVHLASSARRSCTSTALTFQGERSTKAKEEGWQLM